MCWRTYRHLRKIASCWTSHKVIELNKGMPKYPVWSLVLVAWVVFAFSVVAEGTYDSSYGSTLLVKVQNTSASERRVFVHSGCLVVMLDGNKLRENMENSICLDSDFSRILSRPGFASLEGRICLLHSTIHTAAMFGNKHLFFLFHAAT